MVFVTVSNPETEGTQTKYRVTTHRSEVAASSSGEPGKEVHHRHSEFLWLYERLIKERRGAIIPIGGLCFGIAAKAGVAATGSPGNSDDTVTEQCRRLNAFMRNVSSNPELQGAPSLEAFVAHGTGEDFDAAKAKVEAEAGGSSESSDDEAKDGEGSAATSPAPKTSSKAPKHTGFRQYVAKTVAKTAMAIAAKGGKTKLYETEDEERIKVAEQYVKDLEMQVRAMTSSASTLTSSGTNSAVAWAEFGEAAGGWAEVLKGWHAQDAAGGTKLISEKTDSVRGSVSVTETDENAGMPDPALDATCARLEEVKHLSVKASAKMTEVIGHEKEKFADCVHDLLALVLAIKVALHKRSNSQLMCTSCIQQASKLSSQASAGNEESKKAEKAAEEAKEELEQATKRFLREIKRVDSDLDRQLGKALQEYARIQLEKAEGLREVWTEMIKICKPVAERREGDSGVGEKEGHSEAVEASLPTGRPEPTAPPLE